MPFSSLFGCREDHVILALEGAEVLRTTRGVDEIDFRRVAVLSPPPGQLDCACLAAGKLGFVISIESDQFFVGKEEVVQIE